MCFLQPYCWVFWRFKTTTFLKIKIQATYPRVWEMLPEIILFQSGFFFFFVENKLKYTDISQNTWHFECLLKWLLIPKWLANILRNPQNEY